MSDGINILFGEGPLWQAQGPGSSFSMVSELAELAVKLTDRGINARNGTPHTRS